MSDAPERIWIEFDAAEDSTNPPVFEGMIWHQWIDHSTTEYTRADLTQAQLSASQAQVAAAYGALEIASRRLIWCAGIIQNDSGRDKAGDFALEAQEVLRALTPADATAALAARDAEIRNKALDDAAELVATHAYQNTNGSLGLAPSKYARHDQHHATIAKAIIALKELTP